MKRRAMIFLLMIGMVGLAKAQKPDTLQNASIRSIYDLIKIKGKPLIVIDGIIYSVKDKPFDTKDISALEVLHPPGSVNIYGKQAADGAVLITTKQRMIDTANVELSVLKEKKTSSQSDNVGLRDIGSMFNFYKPTIMLNDRVYYDDLDVIDPKSISIIYVFNEPIASALFGSNSIYGAAIVYTKDYYSIKISKKMKPFDSLANNTLYLIDGVISKNGLGDIQEKEILKKNAIKKVRVSIGFNGEVRNGLVVVLTKLAAINSYQNKLSQFSKEYATFLQVNNYDDSGISYINAAKGELWRQSTKEGINLLYKLSVNDILKVEFSPRSENAAGWKPAILSITTKQN